MVPRIGRVVLGLALGALCAYAVVQAGQEIARAARLAREGTVTEATVEGIQKAVRKGRRGTVRHVYVYTLRYDGHVGTVTRDARLGPRVQVIYDPRRPDDVRPFARRHWRDLLDWSGAIWVAGGGFILVTGAGSVAALVGALRQRRGAG